MKTETVDAAKSLKVNAVSLDGFIVRETLAKEVLDQVAPARVARKFTAADLWNIHRGAKKTGWRS